MTSSEIFEWVRNIATLLALISGPPSIILWALNRKGANKKLEIEEGGLGVQQFNALMSGYKDQLDRAGSEIKTLQTDRDRLAEEVVEIKRTQSADQRLFRATARKLERVRRLFLRYSRRVGIPMTLEEQREFEMTAPPKRTA